MKKYIATWLQLTLYLYFAVIFNRSFLFLQLSSPLITYLKLSGSSFSICAYHFSFAVNLKSNGREEFFFISFHYGISIQQQTQLTGGWANTCISEKGVSDSQGSKPNTVVSFLAASKKDSFVSHKNSLTKANYFLAVKTLLDLVRIQCLFQLLSSMSK